MRFTALIICALLFSGIVGAAQEAEPADDPTWHRIVDYKGIQVYRRDGDERLKTFRGVTRMSLADEYAMLALYNDTNAFPDWLHLIDQASDIDRQGPLDRDYRFLIDMPWPIKDREIVLNSRLTHVTSKEAEYVSARLTGRPDLIPRDDRYVRVREVDGIFRLERIGATDVEVTFQITMDPGGYLPGWLVNMIMRDQPFFTLEKLRRVVRREEYAGHYYDYLDLFGPGRPEHLPPPKSWIRGSIPGPQRKAGTSDELRPGLAGVGETH